MSEMDQSITYFYHACVISQSPNYVQKHCKKLDNPFDFACRIWFLYKNPQC